MILVRGKKSVVDNWCDSTLGISCLSLLLFWVLGAMAPILSFCLCGLSNGTWICICSKLLQEAAAEDVNCRVHVEIS